MEDETESGFAAWYDDPSTQREMRIIAQRIPNLTKAGLVMLALQLEILVALNTYGVDQIELDTDPEEPWRDPDGLGFTP